MSGSRSTGRRVSEMPPSRMMIAADHRHHHRALNGKARNAHARLLSARVRLSPVLGRVGAPLAGAGCGRLRPPPSPAARRGAPPRSPPALRRRPRPPRPAAPAAAAARVLRRWPGSTMRSPSRSAAGAGRDDCVAFGQARRDFDELRRRSCPTSIGWNFATSPSAGQEHALLAADVDDRVGRHDQRVLALARP